MTATGLIFIILIPIIILEIITHAKFSKKIREYDEINFKEKIKRYERLKKASIEHFKNKI